MAQVPLPPVDRSPSADTATRLIRVPNPTERGTERGAWGNQAASTPRPERSKEWALRKDPWGREARRGELGSDLSSHKADSPLLTSRQVWVAVLHRLSVLEGR